MDSGALIVRNVARDEHPAILSVYEAVGYTGGIKDEDIGFLATVDEKPVGAVRLSQENGVHVLRGMMVLPEYHRQGIGTALLANLDREIAEKTCYCINPPHLEKFYGRIGFNRIDPSEAPPFLAERLERYKREIHECIMMFRHQF